MAKNANNKVSIWQSLHNAWKVQDIRKKLIYTFFMLILFRLVGVIPAPGVDYVRVKSAMSGSNLPLLDLVNMMTGSNFSNMTIMAMGITPYINSSIIMQLLTIAIPALERLSKSGPDGQKKIASITRYVTVVLAVIQAIGLVYSMGYIKSGWFNTVLVGVSMAAGTALAMWIGERITANGLGNGVSLLIFAGIISNLFNGFTSLLANAFSATSLTPWLTLLAVLLFALVMIVVVTFVDMGVRRIQVQYAKRVTGRKMYGGQSSILPLKVCSVGVMPLIFAMTIMQVPAMIGQFWPDGGFYKFYINYMSASSEHWYGHLVYYVIYSLLIVAFAYFYTTISFNPVEISKNLQQNGGFIPGIRPGRPTGDYLKRISNRLTLFGAIFLMILAIVPTVLLGAFGLSSTFGPTSILIMVSVALETSAQLESMMLMRHYKGFLG